MSRLIRVRTPPFLRAWAHQETCQNYVRAPLPLEWWNNG